MEVILAIFASAIISYVAGRKSGLRKERLTHEDFIRGLDAKPEKPRILAFGYGDFTVEVGRVCSSGPIRSPAVFICRSDTRGEIGALAPPSEGADKSRLASGEIAMIFNTEKQAFDVAEAICGYRPKKINKK